MPLAADAVPSASDARRLALASRWVVALAIVYGLLWLFGSGMDLGLGRYLPLHTTLETAAIVVAMLSFGIAWNAYAESRPGNVVLIGAVLFGTGLLDFAHTLSYLGMPEFVTPSSPQKAIVFWLAARYLAAFGLLAVALRPWQPLLSPAARYWLLVGVCGYVVLVYRVTLFHPDWLPDFFVPGAGLTPLKIGLEYGLVGIYGAAAYVFYRRARGSAPFNAADLFAAAAIACLSELCFTLYSSVTDLFNTAGHVYKIVCYGFIFRAVFVDSVHQPFAALSVALEKEKQWSAEQHSFVRTLDMLDEAVIEMTPDGSIVRANSGWWRLAGSAPLVAYRLQQGLHDADRPAFLALLRELADGERSEYRGRLRLRGDGDQERWLESRFVSELGDDGRVSGIRGVLRDITKSHLQERQISHMALHDALTNLPNRALLEDRIRKAIQLATRNQHHVAVCFIDLDHFKNINDAYGHKVGDALLVALAQILKSRLRDGDTLARWGGDEFVVLLPDLETIETATLVAQKLFEAMRQTLELENLAINATFSMGISVFPDDGEDVDSLLAQADRAMFYAKSQGRNSYQLFSDMTHKGLGKKELYIQARLAQAIREQRIAVWFQPLVAAQPRADGGVRLTGVEALARWHDAEHGQISPASFVPIAESLGLIGELGDLVRRRAFEEFRPWLAMHPDLHLALNVSKRQLFAADFIDALQADVRRYDIPPTAVVIEVTESVALMDVEFAEDRLRELAAAGFVLSIDDFGTGYASLSQLHDLPVGELKIDISFVRRVHAPEGLRMVQAIINMAQALRLRTVAEGVEDERTARILGEAGVDLLQGYYFGRPAPAAELSALPLFAAAGPPAPTA